MSKQEKSAYDDLFKAYDSLKRKHRSVIAKNKASTQLINKLKKDINTLKLRAGTTYRHTYNRKSESATPTLNDDSAEVITTNNTVENALVQIQQRLISAEGTL